MFPDRKQFTRFIALSAATVLLWSNQAMGFRVHPYLQNPSSGGMTILWISEDQQPGEVTYSTDGIEPVKVASSSVEATALDYHESELDKMAVDQAPPLPYQHRVRLENLEPDTVYTYDVLHGDETFEASFKTPPEAEGPLRFIVYADSETEPESTGKKVQWTDPTGTDPSREYIVDQTKGYEENLKVIRSRNPDFIAIAGDIVESGGEQRDWDEFWKHNSGPDKVGSYLPVFPAPGNHEYFSGPGLGGYDTEPSNDAIAKYETYFEVPENGAANARQRERYYRIDYGPVTLISLDSCNGLPNGSQTDSNWYLTGESEGGTAPDYNPGSRQYQWLQQQLEEAQKRSAFIFVMFHHVPYSVGPHGTAPGTPDKQSGRPLRVLLPLLHRYGVDAVFCGHDEMYEHSIVSGITVLPNGAERPHTLHVYDIGIGGDGLRGPVEDLSNPQQLFLAHNDSPEIPGEKGGISDGGKHYGHLEVNVERQENGIWKATITPAYVFPLNTRIGGIWQVLGFERRTYEDILEITKESFPPQETSMVFY